MVENSVNMMQIANVLGLSTPTKKRPMDGP